MNADPAAQLRLLDLQAADTVLAQLRHRRATLAELAAIAKAAQQLTELDISAADIQASSDDLGHEQRKLENEVEAVRARATRDEQRLTAGGLPSKELESLQHEITSLARRQSVLEDDLLEVMEKREGVDAELAGVLASRNSIAAAKADLESKRDDQFADIDDASDIRRKERGVISTEIPVDLLVLYEKVATANGGVGAAEVRQRRCEGCHLELAGNELTTVRHAAPDAVLRCENCRRSLVRTAESGL